MSSPDEYVKQASNDTLLKSNSLLFFAGSGWRETGFTWTSTSDSKSSCFSFLLTILELKTIFFLGLVLLVKESLIILLVVTCYIFYRRKYTEYHRVFILSFMFVHLSTFNYKVHVFICVSCIHVKYLDLVFN